MNNKEVLKLAKESLNLKTKVRADEFVFVLDEQQLEWIAAALRAQVRRDLITEIRNKIIRTDGDYAYVHQLLSDIANGEQTTKEPFNSLDLIASMHRDSAGS